MQISSACHFALLEPDERGNRELIQIQEKTNTRICIANTRCMSRSSDINLANVIIQGEPEDREKAMELITAFAHDISQHKEKHTKES